jgi:hypothetical protein
MCNACRLLHREVRDESSAHNSVLCHSIAMLRGNVTGLCYAVMLQVCFQLVTPYHVTHLQCYEVMLRGSVTSVYPPLDNTHLVG